MIARMAHAPPTEAPKPGEIFAGKYRIERVLGVGGMGYVLAATHVHLNEEVALKLLLPERAKDEQTVARFLREGRAAVKIRNEHVARVLDVGKEDDVPYLVMEFLDGQDLAALLAEQGKLEPETAVDYVLQASEAIVEAHALAIIHRDLKPANLFLVRRPDGRDCVKVLDFGISKMSVDDNVVMTATASTVGTPLYMSPEQLTSSKNVDARTDIWSLGVILFELLGGRPPFQASSVAELGARVLTRDAPDIRQLEPGIPAPLAEAIATCLRRDVDERFSSLAELAAALAPFASDEGRRSSDTIGRVHRGSTTGAEGQRPARRSGKVLPAPSSDALTDSTWGTATGAGVRPPAAPPAKPRTWLIAAGFLLLGVVGVAVGVGARRFAPPPTTSAVAAPVDPTSSASATASSAPTGASAVVSVASSMAPPIPSGSEASVIASARPPSGTPPKNTHARTPAPSTSATGAQAATVEPPIASSKAPAVAPSSTARSPKRIDSTNPYVDP